MVLGMSFLGKIITTSMRPSICLDGNSGIIRKMIKQNRLFHIVWNIDVFLEKLVSGNNPVLDKVILVWYSTHIDSTEIQMNDVFHIQIVSKYIVFGLTADYLGECFSNLDAPEYLLSGGLRYVKTDEPYKDFLVTEYHPRGII